jgi:hypothetical protein
MMINLTPDEVVTLLQWLNVYRGEVDVNEDDYKLFMSKIAPLLPPRFDGTIREHSTSVSRKQLLGLLPVSVRSGMAMYTHAFYVTPN